MLVFNGIKFAKNNDELVESLFDPTGTASGLYKKTKTGTKLYKATGELFAYIVHNQKQGYFVVSASIYEGKAHYMFALSSIDERFLGLSDKGLQDTHDIVKDFVKQNYGG